MYMITYMLDAFKFDVKELLSYAFSGATSTYGTNYASTLT